MGSGTDGFPHISARVVGSRDVVYLDRLGAKRNLNLIRWDDDWNDTGVSSAWTHFYDHRVLRAATKRRMFKRIDQSKQKEGTVQSYLGLISMDAYPKIGGFKSVFCKQREVWIYSFAIHEKGICLTYLTYGATACVRKDY